MKNKTGTFPYRFFMVLLLLIFCCWSFSGTAKAATTKIKYKSKVLYVNGTYKITLLNKKSGATYFYSSSKTQIAKVNSKGIVTALSKGTAKIKVRYRYRKKMHTLGTVTISVRKSTIRSSASALSAIVGQTYRPADYLNDANKNATYQITSTSPAVATGDDKGSITIKKSGTATLTIIEKYNNKKRILGKVSVAVTGASLGETQIRMGYNTTYDVQPLLRDPVLGAKYHLKSSNQDLLMSSALVLIAGVSPGYDETVTVDVYETQGTKDRKIGSLTINMIDSAYICPENRTVYIGLGETLSIDEQGIIITNADIYSTYRIEPDNPDLFDENWATTMYGTTNVTIYETNLYGETTILPERVTIIVNLAQLDATLYEQGLDIYLLGDTFDRFPVSCRNHKMIYKYTTSNRTVCTAGTNEDGTLHLIPKKSGSVSISVTEISSDGKKQRKLGSFIVRVHANN